LKPRSIKSVPIAHFKKQSKQHPVVTITWKRGS